MTEAPDEYPDVPDDDSTADPGVEGLVDPPLEPMVDTLGGDEVRTGDPRVDTVLDSLDGLDERPVEEHAAVFERAHAELRAWLEPDHDGRRTP
jgi:hypothetical protein